jgi:hypothetical protein
MKSSSLYLTSLVQRIAYRILALFVVLSIIPLAIAAESDVHNSSMPEPHIDLEHPFVLTIYFYHIQKDAKDARELADSVGAKVIQENPMAAKYWLRLSTKSLTEVGAIMDKLEADPRVFRVKWDIH